MNMTGQRIGKFLLQEKFKKNNRIYYRCLCDCGNLVEVRSDSLTRNNYNKSCGCSGISSGPKRRPNEIQLYVDHAEIPIKSKRLGDIKILIDLESVPLLNKYRWSLSSRYIATRIKCKMVMLHHLLLPRKEGFVTDHINRDPFDNRKANLRYATAQQNSWNSFPKNGAFKGTTFNKRYKKWRTMVMIEGKKTLIGDFDTQEESLLAYDFTVSNERGEFSVTNFSYVQKEYLQKWLNKAQEDIQKKKMEIINLKEKITRIKFFLESSPIPATTAVKTSTDSMSNSGAIP